MDLKVIMNCSNVYAGNRKNLKYEVLQTNRINV